MKAYKQFILAILALIGVLAPCAVEVNLNRTYVQEVVEYVNLAVETAEHEAVEVAARMSIKIEKDEEKCETVEAVEKKSQTYTSNVLPFEKRRTHQFYGRMAGGLPDETNFLLAS